MNKVTIAPITRLEGHGKIEIFLDEAENVVNVEFGKLGLKLFNDFVLAKDLITGDG